MPFVAVLFLGLSFVVDAKRPSTKSVRIASVHRREWNTRFTQAKPQSPVQLEWYRLDKPEIVISVATSSGTGNTTRYEFVVEKNKLYPSNRTHRGNGALMPSWILEFVDQHAAEIISHARPGQRPPAAILRRDLELEAYALLGEEEMREIVAKAEVGPVRNRDKRVVDALMLALAEQGSLGRYGRAP